MKTCTVHHSSKCFFTIVILVLLSTLLQLPADTSLDGLMQSTKPLCTDADNHGSLISAEEIYARVEGNLLTVAVAGQNLQFADRYNLFIDADACDSTGYRRWLRSGADFMVENGRLYSSASDSNQWEWERIEGADVTLEIAPDGTKLGMHIQIADLAASSPDLFLGDIHKMRMAFMYYSTTHDGEEGYLPGCMKGMAPVFPDVDGTETDQNGESSLIHAIPNAIGLGIDDLGWDSGYYRKDEQGNPTEEKRNWYLADYQNVVDIGRAVGSRLMTAWIVADIDMEGIAARPEYNPPETYCYMTSRGTRPAPVDDREKIEALMQLVEDGADGMEFGIHGVSHEHYYPKHDGTTGRISREFAYKPDGTYGFSYRYDWNDMVKRMECYIEIIRQFYDEETCSVPESIVFPGHGYYYGDGTGDETTGRLMNLFGIKYANGATSSCTTIGEGTIDNGLLFINRGFGAAYDAIAATPWDGTNYPNGLYLPNSYGWTEAHFPNLWNTDVDTTDGFEKWVAYLNGLNDSPGRYLAPNTVQGSSQWLYRHYAVLEPRDRHTVTIDTSGIPDAAYEHDLLSTLVLKVPLEAGTHVSSAVIDNGARVVGYHEDDFGYGYLRIGHVSNPMGRLSPETIYTLSVTTGPEYLETYVDLSKKTFNIYSLHAAEGRIRMDIEMYGTQDVVIRTSGVPKTVSSSNPNLTILQARYAAPFLTLQVRGKDIQGESGTLMIKF